MSEYAFGVDAGGSGTQLAAVRLGGDETVLSRTGPANATTAGAARAGAIIADAIAGVLPAGARPVRAYVGAAGAGAARTRAIVCDVLTARFPSLAGSLHVGDDLQISLRSVIPEGPGVAVIAGTGSGAYAENGAHSVRVGGAGYLLGDEGSGFAIGFAALQLAARAYDGRAPHDETVRLVERVFAVDDRDALLGRVYDGPLDIPRVAALAPVLIAFAGKHNRAARTIVEGAAGALAALALSAIERAAFGAERVAVALCGGLLRERNLLRTLLEERLQAARPSLQILFESDDATAHARTALRLALVAPGR